MLGGLKVRLSGFGAGVNRVLESAGFKALRLQGYCLGGGFRVSVSAVVSSC